MATLSQILPNSHPGKQVEWNGKKWTIVKTDLNMQGEFGAWLASRAEEIAEKLAENSRKKARKLWRDARKIEEEADGALSTEDKMDIDERYAEVSGEARALDIEARNIMERYQDRWAAGDFEFHGAVSIGGAMQGLPGQVRLVWIILKKHHPELTLSDVMEMHKGFAKEDGKLVFRKGQKVGMIQAWQDAVLEVEGLKNDEEGSPESPASTTPTKSQ